MMTVWFVYVSFVYLGQPPAWRRSIYFHDRETCEQFAVNSERTLSLLAQEKNMIVSYKCGDPERTPSY